MFEIIAFWFFVTFFSLLVVSPPLFLIAAFSGHYSNYVFNRWHNQNDTKSYDRGPRPGKKIASYIMFPHSWLANKTGWAVGIDTPYHVAPLIAGLIFTGVSSAIMYANQWFTNTTTGEKFISDNATIKGLETIPDVMIHVISGVSATLGNFFAWPITLGLIFFAFHLVVMRLMGPIQSMKSKLDKLEDA